MEGSPSRRVRRRGGRFIRGGRLLGALEYAIAVKGVQNLIEKHSLDPELVYIWLDYLSIPQTIPMLKGLAIRSLASYASAANFFLIIAPPAKHREREIICDAASYQRRGWCRLEQWAHFGLGTTPPT